MKFDNYKQMFKLNSGATRLQLWNAIEKYDLMPLECALCGVGCEYNNKRLVHATDHIDGNPKNNELKNLRLVCPNCHSQTDTFCVINGGKSRNYDFDISVLKEAFANSKSICGVATWLQKKFDIKSVSVKYLKIDRRRYNLQFGKRNKNAE